MPTSSPDTPGTASRRSGRWLTTAGSQEPYSIEPPSYASAERCRPLAPHPPSRAAARDRQPGQGICDCCRCPHANGGNNVIFGIIRRDGSRLWPGHLDSMRRAAHDSPRSDASTVLLNPVGFGHAAAATSASPAPSHVVYDRDTIFVGQGRLDNRPELAALAAPGERHSSIRDVELIRRAHIRWGVAAPDRLHGDWSFATYDLRSGDLLVARDHFGDTSMFVLVSRALVAFASDIQVLLAAGLPGLRIDELAVAHSLVNWPMLDSDRTMVEPVRRLLPGHMLTVSATKAGTTRYWCVDDIEPVRLSARSDYIERRTRVIDAFIALSDAAVERRMKADTTGSSPTAISMSGGLDSTIIAALAARHAPSSTIHALTSVPLFDSSHLGDWTDETRLATAAARRIDIPLHFIDGHEITPVVATRRFVDILPDLALQTFNAHWMLPLYGRAADLGCSTLLTGSAGNATVSWHGDITSHPLRAQLRLRGPRWAAARAFAQIRRALAGSSVGQSLAVQDLRARQAAREASPTSIAPALASRLRLHERRAREDQRLDGVSTRGVMLASMATTRGATATLGRAFGVAVRDPTADLGLLRFVLGVPDRVFIDPATGMDRWLIRASMRSFLPDAVTTNRHRYMQGADLVQRLRVQPLEVDEVLVELAEGAAGNYLDVARMRAAWTHVQGELSLASLVEARQVLLRGVMSGLVIQRLTDLITRSIPDSPSDS
ncbi:MAG: asparagine synthase-related protein [Candidatus Limnocylindria bacterium]